MCTAGWGGAVGRGGVVAPDALDGRWTRPIARSVEQQERSDHRAEPVGETGAGAGLPCGAAIGCIAPGAVAPSRPAGRLSAIRAAQSAAGAPPDQPPSEPTRRGGCIASAGALSAGAHPACPAASSESSSVAAVGSCLSTGASEAEALPFQAVPLEGVLPQTPEGGRVHRRRY